MLVIHGSDASPLHELYADAQAAGAWVVHAQNWRDHGKGEPWAARNTAAALIDAARVGEKVGAESIVIMDPDMVWTRRISWPGELAVDRCDLEWIHADRAKAVADRLGIAINGDAHLTHGARVPYVVPLSMARQLGAEWWRVMDAYYELGAWEWSDQMVAFSLAMLSLGVRPRRLRFSKTNGAGAYKSPPDAGLLHYAYDTPYWSKRWFADESEPEWAQLWDPPRLPIGSVQGWVHREIYRAGRFYDRLRVKA